jgi:hypothetical protein
MMEFVTAKKDEGLLVDGFVLRRNEELEEVKEDDESKEEAKEDDFFM